jgi:hypothetical protein
VYTVVKFQFGILFRHSLRGLEENYRKPGRVTNLESEVGDVKLYSPHAHRISEYLIDGVY